MAKIGTLVLKVTEVDRAARFWAGALGYERDDIGGAPTLTPAGGGDGPTLTLDERDRTHLDLFVSGEEELRAEADRLVALGARRVPWEYPPGAGHVVLADTEGNLFCVVNTA
ncbi:MAG TPA: VOC family protein [Micromonosporaceae bacterium]|nr:VOC family protein [Micromonosporaceae bacterium]